MSTIIKTQSVSGVAPIRNLEALKRTVTRMGVLYDEKATTIKSWNGAETVDNLVGVIKHPEGGYEIGVVKQDDGYTLAADYMSSKLTGVVGGVHYDQDPKKGYAPTLAPLLMQQYYMETFKETAEAEGHSIQFKTLPNGDVEAVITPSTEGLSY